MPYKDPIKAAQVKDEYQLKKRSQLKLKVLEYLLDHPCVDCGIDDPRVLDFDHIDRTTKVKPVGLMINSKFSWERIQGEISKCEVRCANCHRIKTYEELGYWKHLDTFRG